MKNADFSFFPCVLQPPKPPDGGLNRLRCHKFTEVPPPGDSGAAFVTEGTSSASMARGIGGKGGRYMKSKITYTDEQMGEARVVKDFLLPPDQLVLNDESVKITISLRKSSVEFFKREAQKNHTSYQKMIRQVIDLYTAHFQKNAR